MRGCASTGCEYDGRKLKPEEWSHVQAASLPLVWLTARTRIACVEPHAKGTPSKRLVALGGSSATCMYTNFIAKARWKVLSRCSGRKCGLCHQYYGRGRGGRLHGRGVKVWKPDAIVDCVGGTECLGIAKRYVIVVGDKIA